MSNFIDYSQDKLKHYRVVIKNRHNEWTVNKIQSIKPYNERLEWWYLIWVKGYYVSFDIHGNFIREDSNNGAKEVCLIDTRLQKTFSIPLEVEQ
jgi:hypothetical protein